jgi:hypothetical protein
MRIGGRVAVVYRKVVSERIGSADRRSVVETTMRAGNSITIQPPSPLLLELKIYQMHHDGSIWRYTGQLCRGRSCPRMGTAGPQRCDDCNRRCG